MAFVIVTPPNPPGSKQLISPPEAVFEIAPGKVLHGAVRLHGLASSPTPDTHVRVACACASEAKDTQTANTTKALKASLLSFIRFLLTTFPEQRMYRSRKVLQKTKSLRKRRRQMSWFGTAVIIWGIKRQSFGNFSLRTNDKEGLVSVNMCQILSMAQREDVEG